MTSLFESAAKIVFILIAVTSCGAFFMGILESKDFMLLAAMTFSFYFATPIASDSTGANASRGK